MSAVRALLRAQRGSSAAEFALVLPLMLLFLLGIIDVGRFVWNLNEAEKATQTGTRWAVATDMIPTGLYTYSFSTSGGLPMGSVVPQSAFPGVKCTATACECKGSGCNTFGLTRNGAAFDGLVARMHQIYGGIGPENVEVHYDWSGLGYAGDPVGSDVDPLVTVRLADVPFQPIFLLGQFDFDLPPLSYTLTMEDGQGGYSN